MTAPERPMRECEPGYLPADLETIRKAFPDLGFVLVVDDHEEIRTILRMNLQNASYRVAEAANGREALALLARERPDLVLLDVMMPEMDGITALREIRGTPALRDLPVIMVSALGDVEDISSLVNAGAVDYVVKPVILAQFLPKVDQAMQVSRVELLEAARQSGY